MRCPKCQTENAYNAEYCWKCEAELRPGGGGVPGGQGRTAHPYHTLGGWLGLLAYGTLIGGIVTAAGMFFSAAALVRLASYLESGLIGGLGVFELILCVPLLWYSVKMFSMIRRKDPLFLRMYEKMMLLLCGINVVLIFIATRVSSTSPADGVRSLLGGIIIFAVWLTYFRRSVRVRTYFGSDEYLRKSIFLNGCTAPDPADRS